MTAEQGRQWLTGIAVAGSVWLLGWLVLRLLLRPLTRLFRHTKTELDDILVVALKNHIPIWFLALGLAVGARWVPISAEALKWVDRTLVAVVILSASLALSTLLTQLLARRAAPGLDAVPVNTLIQNLIRALVLGLGLVILLGHLGVEITPLLTALGVGSLAVALALQPTLSNLFAGFHILLSRHVRVGDFVEMEAGQHGRVIDIGWRSILIQEMPENTYIVPNARFAEMVVKNYSFPGGEHSMPVEVTVSLESDLERVETVTLEVAREVADSVPGAVPGFEPTVQFRSFGDSGVRLAVILRVREFPERNLVAHEMVKRLHSRYRVEGIEVPYPQRVVRFATVPPPSSPGAL
jgi:small-conductance mechanosensitive channel